MAWAQAPTAPADPATASIRVGVLALDPRFSITNAGVDTNVFASVDNPQRDVTATASTGVDLWLRTGRGLLMVGAESRYVHYERFVTERGLNTEARAMYELRLNRATAFTWATTRHIKDRPSEEITARLRHHGTEFGGGMDMRVLSRTTARVEWYRARTGYAEGSRFDGEDLRTQLNQVVDTVAITARQRLTALTTFVANASHGRNRFDHQPARDSESLRTNAGFELGQFALIRGIVLFGYHQLHADNPALQPEFSGVTASLNVAYTAPSQTRLETVIGRDLRQSYDPLTPNYTQLVWTAVATQRVFGRWDLQVRGGRSRENYLSVGGAADRTGFTDRIGGSLGYSIANQVRLGMDIASVKRTSELPGQRYRGVASGISVTYGY